MWILPSLSRPKSLERFFNAYRATGATTPGMVLIDKNDMAENGEAYGQLLLPPEWEIVETEGVIQGDKIREVWKQVADADWIGLLGDDCLPETPEWDRKMIAALNGWNFVSCNDDWQAPNRVANCWVASGDLVRAIGYFIPPEIQHMFIDDMWEMFGKSAQNWQVLMHVKVKHLHVLKNEAQEDETHKRAYNKQIWEHDEKIFREWTVNELSSIIDKIINLARSKGARMIKTDMRGMHIYIGTPSGDGKYEDAFVWGMLGTVKMIEQRGGQWSWGREKYNSDINLARAKIAHTFLQSSCTHLLFIDSDMGWAASAVERLVYAKKDFVGVAGPKKLDPLKSMQFAANYADENGRPKILNVDPETMCAEISEVGAAFTLLSRSCVQRITDAHKELVGDAQGKNIPFIFMPFINKKGLYRGEDFAFCERWRKLGGKVYLCPDIPLSHVGSYTWHGSIQGEFEKMTQLVPIPKEAAQ